MLIREMIDAVVARTGTGRRTARRLISDGAERLDYACDTEEDTYTDQDVVDYAVQCWEDENERGYGPQCKRR
jgi:electron transfer flavoprotein alpha subunit